MGNDWGGKGGNDWKDNKQSWDQDKKWDKRDDRRDDWKKDDWKKDDWKKDDWKKDDWKNDWKKDEPVSGTKLYVKNLPEDIEESAVEYVFKTYGPLEKVVLHTNKSVNGCISAFVEYGNKEDAEVAISALSDTYEIRPGYGPIQVKHAMVKDRARPY